MPNDACKNIFAVWTHDFSIVEGLEAFDFSILNVCEVIILLDSLFFVGAFLIIVLLFMSIVI